MDTRAAVVVVAYFRASIQPLSLSVSEEDDIDRQVAMREAVGAVSGLNACTAAAKTEKSDIKRQR